MFKHKFGKGVLDVYTKKQIFVKDPGLVGFLKSLITFNPKN